MRELLQEVMRLLFPAVHQTSPVFRYLLRVLLPLSRKREESPLRMPTNLRPV